MDKSVCVSLHIGYSPDAFDVNKQCVPTVCWNSQCTYCSLVDCSVYGQITVTGTNTYSEHANGARVKLIFDFIGIKIDVLSLPLLAR